MKAPAADAGFEELLRFLQHARGIDFTGYKRPSLMRRVLGRMHLIGIKGFDAYRDYLEVHPEEFEQLFNAILINVTSFFRDDTAWDYVRKNLVPEMLAAKHAHDGVRVWSAGCASGEEAYSIAIVLAEAMGADAFRERVKIYATDIDEEALNQARAAAYPAKAMESVEPALREKYFELNGERHVFRPDLRRGVIFGRHDLVQDAPISRLDLLVCRNTLMYLNAETQAGVLERFHFALNGEGNGSGYLFLGRAEMLLSHPSLFTPLELRCRVFTKTQQPGQRGRAEPAALGNQAEDNGRARQSLLKELALEESPVARLVVDLDGTLATANARARSLLSINAKDVGRLLHDLEVSYRPVELRSMLEQAYVERRPVTRTSVERTSPSGESQLFDVVVAPLYDHKRNPAGAAVSFVDITRYSRVAEELQRTREEVQTTNEELQSSNEELETTNEELQSSNEELETTNEELQSTNEELETMNEELQSTNEELQTVNEELRDRTEDVNRLNAFFESVLAGMRSAAVVLNKRLEVLMWNQPAGELWGLRADEVQGKPLVNLDIGLPVAELVAPIRACLSGEADHEEVSVTAVNRRGRKIQCRVSCTPLVLPDKKREGVILLMDETA